MNSLAINNTKKTFSKLPWIICGLGALFYCYEYFLRVSPSVMTHELMNVFHLDATSFGNLAAFYYYAYTPMQLPVGVMMDHYGPRRLLIFACLVCALGTYMFSIPHHLFLAQIGRFLVGFGSAFAFVGVLKLATIWLPAERFAMFAGITTTLGMVGAMTGVITLSALVKNHGWEHTLILCAVLGIVLALIIGLVMPDTERQIGKPAHTQREDFKLLLIGVGKLMKNSRIWLNGTIGCILYLPLSAFAELWGVPYLQAARHYSAPDAANAISIIFFGWAVGGPVAGFISDRINRRNLPLIIGAFFTAITSMLMLYVADLPYPIMMMILFLFGVACSVQSIVFAIARDICPHQLAGTSIALTNMIVMLGGVIFQPVIGMLLDLHKEMILSNNGHAYTATDYQFALSVIPILTIIGCVLLAVLKEPVILNQREIKFENGGMTP